MSANNKIERATTVRIVPNGGRFGNRPVDEINKELEDKGFEPVSSDEFRYNGTAIIVIVIDGIQSVFCSYYDTEISFAQWEIIGRTKKSLADLWAAKDRQYLRS